MVKSICTSGKGPEFSSQHPCQVASVPETPVPIPLASVDTVIRMCAHAHTHIKTKQNLNVIPHNIC